MPTLRTWDEMLASRDSAPQDHCSVGVDSPVDLVSDSDEEAGVATGPDGHLQGPSSSKASAVYTNCLTGQKQRILPDGQRQRVLPSGETVALPSTAATTQAKKKKARVVVKKPSSKAQLAMDNDNVLPADANLKLTTANTSPRRYLQVKVVIQVTEAMSKDHAEIMPGIKQTLQERLANTDMPPCTLGMLRMEASQLRSTALGPR